MPSRTPRSGDRKGLSRGLKLAFGLLISAAFLYGTLAAIDLGKMTDILGKADPFWIGVSLGSVALAYGLKIYRWTIMLRSLGANVRLSDTSVPFMGGVAFNNVLPFRAGDVIRVVAFQRFTGVAPSGQLGTLALERLLDLLVLMSILFATVSLRSIPLLDETLLSGLRLAAVGIAVAILLFLAAPRLIQVVVRRGQESLPRLRPAGDAMLRLLEAVAVLSRPLFLARVTAISVIAWLAEGGAYFAVGMALGVAPTAEAALLALSIGTLSTIIPSSPGYVGTFHYFVARVVSAFGAGQPAAAAYAILIHALLWLSTTICGFLLLALAGITARRPLAPRPAD